MFRVIRNIIFYYPDKKHKKKKQTYTIVIIFIKRGCRGKNWNRIHYGWWCTSTLIEGFGHCSLAIDLTRHTVFVDGRIQIENWIVYRDKTLNGRHHVQTPCRYHCTVDRRQKKTYSLWCQTSARKDKKKMKQECADGRET